MVGDAVIATGNAERLNTLGKKKCSRLLLKLLLLNTMIKTAEVSYYCLEKLLLLSIITTAGTRVNAAEGLLLLEDLMLSEKISRPYQRKDKDELKIKIRICFKELQIPSSAQIHKTSGVCISTSSTNEVNTAYGVSTANTQEEMDLCGKLAFLSMRARRFFQKTGRKITINGSDTAGYVQRLRNRNQDRSRRTIPVEYTSSKSMVAINGAGFDWSYMADDEVPTNMALMAFSDSEVYNDKTCSKTCLKSFETLKTQLDNLRTEFNKSEFNLATYKRGLASVEEQLVFYKKNEVMFYKQIAVLKRDISYKDSEISVLKSELEKLKQEKESNQLKIDIFENASKSLDKLIGSQITDNSRKGVGFVSYNAVSPPPTGLFSPPKLDLSNSGLEEFQQPEFEGYGPKPSKNVSEDISNEVKESTDTPLVEELVSAV
ncbi:hypothetical protein Tco_0204387 [Tanacetum coccineum]